MVKDSEKSIGSTSDNTNPCCGPGLTFTVQILSHLMFGFQHGQ